MGLIEILRPPGCITLMLGALIVLFSLIYNLTVPVEHYCSDMGTYAYVGLALTSPFNIGCESPITQITTLVGLIGVLGNLIFVLVAAFLVEKALNSDTTLKLNVFVASILASYITSGISLFVLSHTLSVGTSVIGISMCLALIGFFLMKWWNSRAKFQIWLFVVFLFGVTTAFYSGKDAVAHAIGGILFLSYMGTFLALKWLERRRKGRMIAATQTRRIS